MVFKEMLQGLGKGSKRRKEMINGLDEKLRIQKLVEDRQKSSNERELERLEDEDREEMIKERLEFMRKKREIDINFGHNPLNAENIMNKTEWEVLKEKNQFSNNKCMFIGQKNIHKSNKNLLKNNRKLFGI